LRAPWREDRWAAGWNAHGDDIAAYDAPTGVQALGELLRIFVIHGTSRKTLPNRAREMIQARKGARAVNRDGDGFCEHVCPGLRGAASDKALPITKQSQLRKRASSPVHETALSR